MGYDSLPKRAVKRDEKSTVKSASKPELKSYGRNDDSVRSDSQRSLLSEAQNPKLGGVEAELPRVSRKGPRIGHSPVQVEPSPVEQTQPKVSDSAPDFIRLSKKGPRLSQEGVRKSESPVTRPESSNTQIQKDGCRKGLKGPYANISMDSKGADGPKLLVRQGQKGPDPRRPCGKSQALLSSDVRAKAELSEQDKTKMTAPVSDGLSVTKESVSSGGKTNISEREKSPKPLAPKPLPVEGPLKGSEVKEKPQIVPKISKQYSEDKTKYKAKSSADDDWVDSKVQKSRVKVDSPRMPKKSSFDGDGGKHSVKGTDEAGRKPKPHKKEHDKKKNKRDDDGEYKGARFRNEEIFGFGDFKKNDGQYRPPSAPKPKQSRNSNQK
jgi:hypothetical protein